MGDTKMKGDIDGYLKARPLAIPFEKLFEMKHSNRKAFMIAEKKKELGKTVLTVFQCKLVERMNTNVITGKRQDNFLDFANLSCSAPFLRVS